MAQPKGTKRLKPYEYNLPPRKCQFPGCENEFIPSNPNQHYCKETHYSKCEVCGALFIQKDLVIRRKTCSKGCQYALTVQHRPPASEWIPKAIATNLAHRGTMFPMQSKETHEKSQQTCFLHYGTRFPSQSPVIQEQTVQMFLDKYNVMYPCQLPKVRGSYRSISKPNKKFAQNLIAAGIPVAYDFPLGRYLYDLHVPGTNVLIEINPTITHNTHMSPWGKGVSPDYHIKKTKFAESKGYVCIPVWDWDSTVDIVVKLRFCKAFKIQSREPILHWYNEKTKSHITSSDKDYDNMLSLGYLPVYDDGNMIEYIS